MIEDFKSRSLLCRFLRAFEVIAVSSRPAVELTELKKWV